MLHLCALCLTCEADTTQTENAAHCACTYELLCVHMFKHMMGVICAVLSSLSIIVSYLCGSINVLHVLWMKGKKYLNTYIFNS